MDLDHLNLQVRDPDACRAFYERHFGFRLAYGAEDGWFLRNDAGFLLALVRADAHQPLPPGMHIGFRLEGVEEIDRLHSRLAAAGAPLSAVEDHRPGEDHVTFRCRDPDGTEIEVFWEPPAPPGGSP